MSITHCVYYRQTVLNLHVMVPLGPIQRFVFILQSLQHKIMHPMLSAFILWYWVSFCCLYYFPQDTVGPTARIQAVSLLSCGGLFLMQLIKDY